MRIIRKALRHFLPSTFLFQLSDEITIIIFSNGDSRAARGGIGRNVDRFCFTFQISIILYAIVVIAYAINYILRKYYLK